jgi:hypothetical protein
MNKWIWIFSTLLFTAHGQIVLPDFVNPGSERPRQEQIIVPEDNTHQADEEDVEDQEPTQRIISEEQMKMSMLSNNVQMNTIPEQKAKPGEDLEELKAIYLSGPEKLIVTLKTIKGEQFNASIQNQTFLVETAIGRLPVRVHEIQSLNQERETGIFRIETQDGDLVRGKLQNVFFYLTLQDGSERTVAGKTITRLNASSE